VKTVGGLDDGQDGSVTVQLLHPFECQISGTGQATATIVHPDVTVSSPGSPSGEFDVPEAGRTEVDVSAGLDASYVAADGASVQLTVPDGASYLTFWTAETGGTQLVPNASGIFETAALPSSGEYSGSVWVEDDAPAGAQVAPSTTILAQVVAGGQTVSGNPLAAQPQYTVTGSYNQKQLTSPSGAWGNFVFHFSLSVSPAPLPLKGAAPGTPAGWVIQEINVSFSPSVNDKLNNGTWHYWVALPVFPNNTRVQSKYFMVTGASKANLSGTPGDIWVTGQAYYYPNTAGQATPPGFTPNNRRLLNPDGTNRAAGELASTNDPSSSLKPDSNVYDDSIWAKWSVFPKENPMPGYKNGQVLITVLGDLGAGR
jgi:hypothetical protein